MAELTRYHHRAGRAITAWTVYQCNREGSHIHYAAFISDLKATKANIATAYWLPLGNKGKRSRINFHTQKYLSDRVILTVPIEDYVVDSASAIASGNFARDGNASCTADVWKDVQEEGLLNSARRAWLDQGRWCPWLGRCALAPNCDSLNDASLPTLQRVSRARFTLNKTVLALVGERCEEQPPGRQH